MKRKYGKRRTRRSKKAYKKYKRARKRSYRATKRTMPVTIVPDRILTKLRFVEEYSINTSLIIRQNNVYRGNGPHDPRAASGGVQPTGFDQWATFFRRYKCYGSSITVKFLSAATSAATQNWWAACWPSAEGSPTNATILDEVEMLPYVTSRLFNISAPWAATIKKYMSTAKILGVPKSAIDKEMDYSAVTNTVPIREWYWNIMVQAPGGTTFTATARVYITYYVEFFDRVTPTPS